MPSVGLAQDFVPQNLWQNDVTIVLQDAATILQLRMDMILGQNVSSNFSFVWPTVLDKMGHSLQNVITAGCSLNVPETGTRTG